MSDPSPDPSSDPSPDHQGSSESTDGGAVSTASLVTMDTLGSNVWMVPLTDVQHYDYGRKGKLLVSTRHGLYEADSRQRTVDKLKKPTSGKRTHLVLKPLVWCMFAEMLWYQS